MPFNSNQYSWNDIRVIILGRDVAGLQGVKYSRKVEKEYVYGRGGKPQGIQSGNEAIEGSITLLQSELEAIVTAVKAADPTARITDVSFDLVVTYGNAGDSTTDILKNVELMEYEKGMSQGDKNMTIELPFMALDLIEGA